MANEALTSPLPAAPLADTATPAGSSKKKLLIAAVVLLTTVAECLAAYLYLPSSAPASGAEDSAPAEHRPAGATDKHGAHGKHASGDSSASHADDYSDPSDNERGKPVLGHFKREAGDPHEVDLGTFRVTAYQPLSNTTLRLDFHIFGTVVDGQEGEFASTFEAKKQRFRDQVITLVRSVEITDFTEAGLGLIKRRILETSNKTFGRSYLQSVVFSEFSFIEQ